jgi:transcriptional regulator with XRE-family HTH domain
VAYPSPTFTCERIGTMGARGPKTGYTPDCCDEARRACMLGATNEELAGLLGVSRATIHNWMEEFPDFKRAIEEGKVAADARVAEKLYQRAIGYERPATRFFANAEGPPTQIDYTYHHAPDTSAAIFWLRNRRREDWREQVEHRHSTSHELLVVLEAARLRARPSSSVATPAALPAPLEGRAEPALEQGGAQSGGGKENGDVRRD